MKCPLMIAHVPLAMSEDNPAVGDCIKKECGFWSHSSNGCALPIIAEELHWISERLNAVAEKLPGKVVL